MKILVDLKYNSYIEKKVRAVRKKHPHVEVYTDVDRAPLGEIELFLGGLIPPEVLEEAHNLKMILVAFTGVNHLPLGKLRDRGIRVVNTHGNSFYVAEHAGGMLLSLMGRITEYHWDLKQERWHGFWIGAGLEDGWTSLKGKTVAILGTGGIGLECARILQPFGGTLLGYRRSPVDLPPFHRISVDIDEVLDEAEVVIVTLPLTSGTRGLINAERLSRMEGKILVNVGRGPVVEEEALYRALSEGILAGAALDTWYTYPRGQTTGAPSRFPIHHMKNVLLSPHVGGFTEEALQANIDDSFNNLDLYLSGKPLKNMVSLEDEY